MYCGECGCCWSWGEFGILTCYILPESNFFFLHVSFSLSFLPYSLSTFGGDSNTCKRLDETRNDLDTRHMESNAAMAREIFPHLYRKEEPVCSRRHLFSCHSFKFHCYFSSCNHSPNLRIMLLLKSLPNLGCWCRSHKSERDLELCLA